MRRGFGWSLSSDCEVLMEDLMHCFQCGALALPAREERNITIGARSTIVIEEFMRCSDCGVVFYLPGQMEAAQERAVEQIRLNEELLLGSEIRRVRERLQLTQSELERLIGVGAK